MHYTTPVVASAGMMRTAWLRVIDAHVWSWTWGSGLMNMWKISTVTLLSPCGSTSPNISGSARSTVSAASPPFRCFSSPAILICHLTQLSRSWSEPTPCVSSHFISICVFIAPRSQPSAPSLSTPASVPTLATATPRSLSPCLAPTCSPLISQFTSSLLCSLISAPINQSIAYLCL